MILTGTNKFFIFCFCLVFSSVNLMADPNPVFQPQTRVDLTVADEWEPSIAADAYGHVYVLIPLFVNAQTSTIPGCATCPSPTAFLFVSNDNGTTWVNKGFIAPPGSGQIDVQIKVDPMNGRTVYAS